MDWTEDVWGVSERQSLDYLWLNSKDMSSFRYIAKEHGYTDNDIENFISDHISSHPVITDITEELIRKHRKRP